MLARHEPLILNPRFQSLDEIGESIALHRHLGPL